MEKIYELKEFLFEKKYYVIGGVIFLILLGCSSYFCYKNLNKTEEDIVFLEEAPKEVEETEEECYVSVDIKGEVKIPGLYEVVCESRIQDVINIAGGITTKADTSILNLGKKVSDEMVIIVYSKTEVANFTATKNEEIKKIEKCIDYNEITNDACITEDTFSNQIINDNNQNNGDTPVKVLVSINNATKEELMTLSGIGESKANNIISYRNEVGNFKTIEEIKNVKGIGDSIFEKIKENITL